MSKLLALLFARYVVTDSYGTTQYVYSWKDAVDWLRYAAPTASIRDRLLSVTIVRTRS
jgi:hypothetical protein